MQYQKIHPLEECLFEENCKEKTKRKNRKILRIQKTYYNPNILSLITIISILFLFFLLCVFPGLYIQKTYKKDFIAKPIKIYFDQKCKIIINETDENSFLYYKKIQFLIIENKDSTIYQTKKDMFFDEEFCSMQIYLNRNQKEEKIPDEAEEADASYLFSNLIELSVKCEMKCEIYSTNQTQLSMFLVIFAYDSTNINLQNIYLNFLKISTVSSEIFLNNVVIKDAKMNLSFTNIQLILKDTDSYFLDFPIINDSTYFVVSEKPIEKSTIPNIRLFLNNDSKKKMTVVTKLTKSKLTITSNNIYNSPDYTNDILHTDYVYDFLKLKDENNNPKIYSEHNNYPEKNYSLMSFIYNEIPKILKIFEKTGVVYFNFKDCSFIEKNIPIGYESYYNIKKNLEKDLTYEKEKDLNDVKKFIALNNSQIFHFIIYNDINNLLKISNVLTNQDEEEEFLYSECIFSSHFDYNKYNKALKPLLFGAVLKNYFLDNKLKIEAFFKTENLDQLIDFIKNYHCFKVSDGIYISKPSTRNYYFFKTYMRANIVQIFPFFPRSFDYYMILFQIFYYFSISLFFCIVVYFIYKGKILLYEIYIQNKNKIKFLSSTNEDFTKTKKEKNSIVKTFKILFLTDVNSLINILLIYFYRRYINSLDKFLDQLLIKEDLMQKNDDQNISDIEIDFDQLEKIYQNYIYCYNLCEEKLDIEILNHKLEKSGFFFVSEGNYGVKILNIFLMKNEIRYPNCKSSLKKFMISYCRKIRRDLEISSRDFINQYKEFCAKNELKEEKEIDFEKLRKKFLLETKQEKITKLKKIKKTNFKINSVFLKKLLTDRPVFKKEDFLKYSPKYTIKDYFFLSIICFIIDLGLFFAVLNYLLLNCVYDVNSIIFKNEIYAKVLFSLVLLDFFLWGISLIIRIFQKPMYGFYAKGIFSIIFNFLLWTLNFYFVFLKIIINLDFLSKPKNILEFKFNNIKSILMFNEVFSLFLIYLIICSFNSLKKKKTFLYKSLIQEQIFNRFNMILESQTQSNESSKNDNEKEFSKFLIEKIQEKKTDNLNAIFKSKLETNFEMEMKVNFNIELFLILFKLLPKEKINEEIFKIFIKTKLSKNNENNFRDMFNFIAINFFEDNNKTNLEIFESLCKNLKMNFFVDKNNLIIKSLINWNKYLNSDYIENLRIFSEKIIDSKIKKDKKKLIFVLNLMNKKEKNIFSFSDSKISRSDVNNLILEIFFGKTNLNFNIKKNKIEKMLNLILKINLTSKMKIDYLFPEDHEFLYQIINDDQKIENYNANYSNIYQNIDNFKYYLALNLKKEIIQIFSKIINTEIDLNLVLYLINIYLFKNEYLRNSMLEENQFFLKDNAYWLETLKIFGIRKSEFIGMLNFAQRIHNNINRKFIRLICAKNNFEQKTDFYISIYYLLNIQKIEDIYMLKNLLKNPFLDIFRHFKFNTKNIIKKIVKTDIWKKISKKMDNKQKDILLNSIKTKRYELYLEENKNIFDEIKKTEFTDEISEFFLQIEILFELSMIKKNKERIFKLFLRFFDYLTNDKKEITFFKLFFNLSFNLKTVDKKTALLEDFSRPIDFSSLTKINIRIIYDFFELFNKKNEKVVFNILKKYFNKKISINIFSVFYQNFNKEQDSFEDLMNISFKAFKHLYKNCNFNNLHKANLLFLKKYFLHQKLIDPEKNENLILIENFTDFMIKKMQKNVMDEKSKAFLNSFMSSVFSKNSYYLIVFFNIYYPNNNNFHNFLEIIFKDSHNNLELLLQMLKQSKNGKLIIEHFLLYFFLKGDIKKKTISHLLKNHFFINNSFINFYNLVLKNKTNFNKLIHDLVEIESIRNEIKTDSKEFLQKKKNFFFKIKKIFEIKHNQQKKDSNEDREILQLLKIKDKFSKIKKTFQLNHFEKIFKNYNFLKVLEKLKIELKEIKLILKIFLGNYSFEDLVSFSNLIKIKNHEVVNLLINFLLIKKQTSLFKKNENIPFDKILNFGSFWFLKQKLSPLFSWILIYSLKNDFYNFKNILTKKIFPKAIFTNEIKITFYLIFSFKMKKNENFIEDLEKYSKLKRKQQFQMINTFESLFFKMLEKNYKSSYFVLIMNNCLMTKSTLSLTIKKHFKINLVFNNFLWNLENQGENIYLLNFFIRYYIFNFLYKKIQDTTYRFNIYFQEILKGEIEFFDFFFQKEVLKKTFKLKFEEGMENFCYYDVNNIEIIESKFKTSLHSNIDYGFNINQEKFYNKELNLNLFNAYLNSNWSEKSQFENLRENYLVMESDPFDYNLGKYLWEKNKQQPFQHIIKSDILMDFKSKLLSSYFECLLENLNEICQKENFISLLKSEEYSKDWIIEPENEKTHFIDFISAYLISKFKTSNNEKYKEYKKKLVFLNVVSSTFKSYPIFEISFYQLYSNLIDLVSLKNIETNSLFSNEEQNALLEITEIVKEDNYCEMNSFVSLIQNLSIMFPLKNEEICRNKIKQKLIEKNNKENDELDNNPLREQSLLSERSFTSNLNQSLNFAMSKVIDVNNSYFYKYKKGAYFNEIFRSFIHEINYNYIKNIFNLSQDLFYSLLNGTGIENILMNLEKNLGDEEELFRNILTNFLGESKDLNHFKKIFEGKITSKLESLFYLTNFLMEEFDVNNFSLLCKKLDIVNKSNKNYIEIYYSILFENKENMLSVWIDSNKDFYVSLQSKQLLKILYESLIYGFNENSFLEIGNYLLKNTDEKNQQFLKLLSNKINWKNTEKKGADININDFKFFLIEEKVDYFEELIFVCECILKNDFSFLLHLNKNQMEMFEKYFEISNPLFLNVLSILVKYREQKNNIEVFKKINKFKNYEINDYLNNFLLEDFSYHNFDIDTIKKIFNFFKYFLEKDIRNILLFYHKNNFKEMYVEFVSIYLYICVKQDIIDFSIYPQLKEFLNVTYKFIFLKSIETNFVNQQEEISYINQNLEEFYEIIWDFDIELILQILSRIEKKKKKSNNDSSSNSILRPSLHQVKFDKEISFSKIKKPPSRIEKLYYYFVNNPKLFLNYDLDLREKEKINKVFIFLEFRNFNEVTPRQIRANPELKIAFGEKNTAALEIISDLSKFVDVKKRVRLYENNTIDILKISHKVFNTFVMEQDHLFELVLELFYKLQNLKDFNKQKDFIENFYGKNNIFLNIDLNFFFALKNEIKSDLPEELYLYFLSEFIIKINLNDKILKDIYQKFSNKPQDIFQEKKYLTKMHHLNLFQEHYEFMKQFKNYEDQNFKKLSLFLVKYLKNGKINSSFYIDIIVLFFASSYKSQKYINFFYDYLIMKTKKEHISKEIFALNIINYTMKKKAKTNADKLLFYFRVTPLNIFFYCCICVIFNNIFKIIQNKVYFESQGNLTLFILNFFFILWIFFLIYKFMIIIKYYQKK